MSKENRESVVQKTVEGIKDFIKKSEMNGSRETSTGERVYFMEQSSSWQPSRGIRTS